MWPFPMAGAEELTETVECRDMKLRVGLKLCDGLVHPNAELLSLHN